MNNYNVNDPEFVNSALYQSFLKANAGTGSLNIRAYAANQAIPISDLKIIITYNIQDNNVTFFEGTTNQSGVIENIKLPAPSAQINNLDAPLSMEYQIRAIYEPDNLDRVYKINMYDKVIVIQNISIVPDMSIKAGGFFGG